MPKTLKPGDNINCYVVDSNGQQSSCAIHVLVVATKQSVHADGLYSAILCIVDERTGGKLTDSSYALAASLFDPPQDHRFFKQSRGL